MEVDDPKRSLVPPSREENDLTMRSTEKIKNGGKGDSNKLQLSDWPLLGSKGGAFSKGGMSFVQKLKGNAGEDDCSDDNDDNEGRKQQLSEGDMSDDEIDSEDCQPFM
ncbi:hypothetical protein K1719_015510 [Acacia pycnantha]|nr:hypothetical protein K1719_015510 [Acacia pycnantha]